MHTRSRLLQRGAIAALVAAATLVSVGGTAQALPNNGGGEVRGCYLAPENTTYPHGTVKILPDGWLYQCWYGVWRPYSGGSGFGGHAASPHSPAIAVQPTGLSATTLTR